MNWRQFTIRTMLLALTGAAIFCAGYLVGFDNGHKGRFDDLIKLIHDTIVPSDWEADEVTTSPTGGYSIVITNDSLVADPFASSSTDTDANDPFASTSD